MQASIGIYSSRSGAYDPSAQAFFTATGITDGTIKNAINTLVLSAKSNGWWSVCYAIYPFVGGDSTKHSYNLKDTGQYQLSFNGGWTHSSTGSLPNGTTGYADTTINLSTVFTLNNTHISFYSRTNTTTGSKMDWGCIKSSNGIQGMLKVNVIGDKVLSDMYDDSGSSGPRAVASNSDSSGHYIMSRISSTSHVIYKAGSSLINQTASSAGSLPNATLYIGARNGTSGVDGFSDRECAFFTVGTGVDSTMASDMYTNIQTFQTSLGRQV